MNDVVADLSGIRLVFRGLSEPLADCVRRHWQRYVTTGAGRAWLELSVRVGGAPAPHGPLSLRDLRSAFGGGRARFEIPHGEVELDTPHAARVRLAPAETGRQYYALVNLLCTALAWSLPSRGTALIHAAGIVVGERAFVLVGPSGSGKTTWSMLARERGAIFLSDDLLLVGLSGERAEALSAPIRADFPEPHGPARWPLAALLFPVHGAAASLAPVSGLRAAARVVANLPFVGERLGIDARLSGFVERLLASAPAYDLTFARDASFLRCLEPLAAACPAPGPDG